MGHQLGEFKVEEAEVLKGITKVRFEIDCSNLLIWVLLSRIVVVQVTIPAKCDEFNFNFHWG